MTRPLLITDCDEVLLHMVAHFRDWLAEAHGIDFAIADENWGEALVRRDTGEKVPMEEVWPFVDGFFDTEMERQTPVKGMIEALDLITAHADIVVLTNLPDHRRQPRIDQLARHGIGHEVYTNQGGKGAALRAIFSRRTSRRSRCSSTISPTSIIRWPRQTPQVWRLHMVAEPLVAHTRPQAADAHARIDDWAHAADWILARFADGLPALALTPAAHEA